MMIQVRTQMEVDGLSGVHDTVSAKSTTWPFLRYTSDDPSGAPMDEAVEMAISMHSMARSNTGGSHEHGGLLKAISVASARAFHNVVRAPRVERTTSSAGTSPNFTKRHSVSDRPTFSQMAQKPVRAQSFLDDRRYPKKEEQGKQHAPHLLSLRSLPGTGENFCCH